MTLSEGLEAAGELINEIDWAEHKKGLERTLNRPPLPQPKQEKAIEARKVSNPIVERRTDGENLGSG